MTKVTCNSSITDFLVDTIVIMTNVVTFVKFSYIGFLCIVLIKDLTTLVSTYSCSLALILYILQGLIIRIEQSAREINHLKLYGVVPKPLALLLRFGTATVEMSVSLYCMILLLSTILMFVTFADFYQRLSGSL